MPSPSPNAVRPLAVLFVAGLLLLAASSASAATYEVSLANGTSFESRYQPEEAAWDSSVLLLLTQYGNWIALDKNDVVEVTTDIESGGFGTVIDTKTVSLGVLANDAPVPEEGGELSQADVLQQFLNSQPPPPDYTVHQFVEPAQAGQGGLPVGYSQQPQSPPLVLSNRP
jgi:hypothetical protein